MKLILLTGTAVAALTMAATGALAEQPNGYYVAGDLGYNWKSDQKLTSDAAAYYRYNLSTKNNGAGFARLGYRFSQKWRVELEGAYRPGTLDKAVGPKTSFPTSPNLADNAIINTSGAAFSSPSGHVNQTSVMANVIRDFASDYRVHPYLGLGIGIDSVSGSASGLISRTSQPILIKGSKTVGAVQGLAGIAYALGPRTTLDFSYRLMAVSKVKYGSTSTPATGNFQGDFTNQTVSVGLRYTFGVVTPPPPPTPAYTPPPPPYVPPTPPMTTPTPTPPTATATPPASSKQFVVYFRFNRSNLTKDADAVVKAAASYAKSSSASKVLVTGYTDTSGSKAYNMKLSERRAKATAKGLAADGVDKSKLSLDWKGEENLAVPTADGTKEPANRRSTIDIMF